MPPNGDGWGCPGIGKAVVTLVGWNPGGHDGVYPSYVRVEPSSGGKPGLRKLIEFARGIVLSGADFGGLKAGSWKKF